MRVVVDTNTIISAFFYPNSKPRKAFDYIRRNGVMLMSVETFDELVSVIYRQKFDKYSTQDLRREFIEAIASQVERMQPNETINVCKDPKDNKFLEVAVAGKAEVILTGDRLLLDLNPFRNIEILPAAEFLIKYSSK